MPCQLPCQSGRVRTCLHRSDMHSLISILYVFTLLSTVVAHTICPSLPPCRCKREWSRPHITCTSIRNTVTLSALIPHARSESPWVTIVNSNISTLRPNAFGSLNVDKLEINASNVTNITKDAFLGLEDLRGLHLTDNMLNAVPAISLRPLINLEVLSLTGNRIVSITTEDVAPLVNLRYLSLSENVIEDIETGSFPVSLLQLGLDANRLETLNGALSDLVKLELLLLANNSFRTLNAHEFESLSALDTLNLADNVLEDVAGAFEGLPKLKFLFLTRNHIRSVEGVFNYVPSLNELNLRGNKLRRLKNLGNLPALKTLDLSDNQMEFIFVDAFENTPNVITLNLSSNLLEEFPDTALVPLNSLVTLDLSRNKLPSIDVTQLWLPTLKHLYLSGNMITTLPDNLFESFESLQELDVTHNLLTTLDMFHVLPLKKLHLHGNPFRCDLSTNQVLDNMSGRLDYRPLCTNGVLPTSQEKIN
uniref:LRRCT domain-containing protein n=1 Tax=Strigamia maritima TaxID=126957 RepID=T1IKC9_STRMM